MDTTTKAKTRTLTDEEINTLWNICLTAQARFKAAEGEVKEWPRISDQYARQAVEAKNWADILSHVPKVTIEVDPE
jgi:hypothetical protein